MTKILLIQDVIPHYRIPIFNLIAQKVDLTVMIVDGEIPQNTLFRTIRVRRFYLPKCGCFHVVNPFSLRNQYDVIISSFAPGARTIELLHHMRKQAKLIYWGIGVSAGYNLRYDEDKSLDRKRVKMLRAADAGLFYSRYPVDKYIKLGIAPEKLFVSPNTVVADPDIAPKEKKNLLFLGSLYKQKRVDLLLEQYLSAYQKNADIPSLYIIGDGDERPTVAEWIRTNRMDEKIFVLGAINEDRRLKEYFEEAIACISPDQAGLSVLKSMGYGVPFITSKNAITGGEIFNISNGVNGVIMDGLNEIENVILDISENREKYIQYGVCARKYYDENRTPDKMADGFLKAIQYVMQLK